MVLGQRGRSTHPGREELEAIGALEAARQITFEDMLDGDGLGRVESLEIDVVLDRAEADGLVELASAAVVVANRPPSYVRGSARLEVREQRSSALASLAGTT